METTLEVRKNREEISKNDKKRVAKRIGSAIRGTGGSLNIYIGSCPDYANDGKAYTFENVGTGVPLLTQRQLECNRTLFEELELFWRSFHMLHITR